MGFIPQNIKMLVFKGAEKQRSKGIYQKRITNNEQPISKNQSFTLILVCARLA
jgi:hypothetical protein